MPKTILIVFPSILFAIGIDLITYNSKGCAWEGCLTEIGFPFEHTGADGIGGTSTNIFLLFFDYIILSGGAFFIMKRFASYIAIRKTKPVQK